MVKLREGSDEWELEDGVNGGDFVREEVELVGGEFLGLLVEMELERLGEFLFRVSGRGVFFAKTDSISW